MDLVSIYTKDNIKNFIRQRTGELKIGDKIQRLSSFSDKDLLKNPARFFLLGIAEDIGVRANYGRAGAGTAFRPALESFLNQQDNEFLTGENICVVGEVVTKDLMENAAKLNPKNKTELAALQKMVTQLDERVSAVVSKIIGAGKIPVIIGGGHNNSYGNIKGASQALGKKINAINCDQHLDFRMTEGRHSGNGFSYAFENNFLDKYSVFGIHEQYNNEAVLEKFKKEPSSLFYHTYESVFIREEIDFKKALMQCIGFVKNNSCGVEIDLDAITNAPTSAKTSSGISPIQARQYAHLCAGNLNAAYLHIAEGAPVLSHIKADNKTGKLIAYLISDFIKAYMKR